MSALLPKADIGADAILFDHARASMFRAHNRQLAIPSRGWLFVISVAPLNVPPPGNVDPESSY
jgi:hypothetical protein